MAVAEAAVPVPEPGSAFAGLITVLSRCRLLRRSREAMPEQNHSSKERSDPTAGRKATLLLGANLLTGPSSAIQPSRALACSCPGPGGAACVQGVPGSS